MKTKVQVHVISRSLQVLVLKMQPERGGYWQPVTGSMEKGETPLLAALRELKEETGLVPKTPIRDLRHSFEFEARGQRFREVAFLAVAEDEFHPTLDPHEHVNFAWVSPEKALEMIHFESNKNVLRLALEQLKSKN